MSRVASKTMLALASLATLASCGGSSGQMEPRYVAVHNTLTAMGLAQTGPISQGSLDRGAEARLPVELAAGTCYSLVALGGRSVDDLGLRVVDSRNEALAEDRSTDRQAAAQVCPARAGAYEVVVSMVAGHGDYTLSMWEGGPRRSGSAGVSAAVGRACDDVEELAVGRLVHGSTVGAAASISSPCTGDSAPERVYSFTVDTMSAVTVDLASTYDAVLYALTSCGDPASAVACNDDYQDVSHSRVTFTAAPGTYFVVVDGYGTNSGEYDLSLDVQPLRPIAEICAAAPPLVPGQPVTESTAGNPNYFQATCSGGATAADRVFRLAVPERSRARIHQRSAHDGALHLRSVCEEPASELACNDDYGGTSESLITAVLDEGAYYVISDGYSSASGDFTLSAELSPAAGGGASADACGNAGRLSVGTVVDVDTFTAADDFSGSCGGAGAADVVQRVEVRNRSTLRVMIPESQFSGVVYVRRACDGTDSELACAAFEVARATQPGQPALSTVLDPGSYYVILDGANPNAFGAAKMSVELIDVAALERDCDRSPLLQPGRTVNGSTAGNQNRFEARCAGNARSPDAVYRIRVRRSQRVVVELTASYDAALHLRSACAEPTSELACNDDSTSQNASRIEATLEPGTYFVIVDGFAANNAGTFSLSYTATDL